VTGAFVSGRSGRLTVGRFVAVLVIGAGACAVVAVAAALIGRATERGGAWELLPVWSLEVGSPLHDIFVFRIKQVLESLVVGAALGASGCALQALLRNPLADPFTLGISSGSSLAAVLAIRLGIEPLLGGWGLSAAALLGALATVALVARFARIGRELPPATLVLVGVTISMFCSSASVLVQSTSDFSEVSHMLGWMLGGLDPGRFALARTLALPLIGALVLLALHARALDALAAGPDVAASLGVAVVRVQTSVFALASLLVGLAIAIGGPIGFVGLVVPHALRATVGPDHRVLLPASMFGGAALLTVCDTIARTATAPSLLPTGAVTAVLGGPFFIGILVSHKRRATMWR
jgi:iron complex transport system permease protein